LGDGLNEIKIDYGPGFLVYLGLIDNEVMLLLGGGDKGNQAREIEKAHEYWRSVNAPT
jgi:putative addiction module killer protein